MNTKVLAMYLPQYHCIPENDKFWGKGFTDWVTVKNATPLFYGHKQPRVPLNGKYYDLSKEENIIWQSKLAKENGVYGFGVYHYWFNNDTNILTKPAEIIRDCDDVKINYFLAWDNANWKRSWSNVEGNAWAPINESQKEKKGPQILIPYVIGGREDWRNHYNALRNHFLCHKYIKIDNKPVFIIFNFSKEIDQMCDYWSELAVDDGFAGIYFIIKRNDETQIPSKYNIFKYEPLYSGWPKRTLSDKIHGKMNKWFGLKNHASIYNYDKVWDNIIENAKKDFARNIYHGAFVRYDDTPRRGERGKLTLGETPDLFKDYLKELLSISNKQNKEFVFLTAWNEWGEGAYLEPDTQNGDSYLAVLKEIM